MCVFLLWCWKVFDTRFTHVEIRIPDRWLRGRSSTTRILVEQEAKDVEQEKDRHNVQIGKKTLKKIQKNMVKSSWQKVLLSLVYLEVVQGHAVRGDLGSQKCDAYHKQEEAVEARTCDEQRSSVKKRKLTWWYSRAVDQTEMHTVDHKEVFFSALNCCQRTSPKKVIGMPPRMLSEQGKKPLKAREKKPLICLFEARNWPTF